ncbi:MAG: hypothetical protein AOA65_0050 [Candidatus Bathyarchaeota archaeon BA1]|nr:MAG: hypothetical protein AOA65_0050 [Candidatus Bathyarchaeota archaeon BA1]
MARQTVEIDNEVWQRFLKTLVDLYGSAYGSKKKEALNEAIQLWLESKTIGVERMELIKRAEQILQERRLSHMIMDLLGEEETFLPIEHERKALVEALRRRRH